MSGRLAPARGVVLGVVLGACLWLILILAAQTVFGQGEVTPLDCLSSLDGMAPYFMADDLPFDTSLAGLSVMSGRPIWLGYANGAWAMPGDARAVFVIVPVMGLGQRGDHRWIVGYISPQAPYVLYLMANEKASYIAEGHAGYHPCGAAAIELREDTNNA